MTHASGAIGALAFSLRYGALLAAMISPYVEKVPLTAGGGPTGRARGGDGHARLPC